MKPYYQDDTVTIYHGDCREIWPTLLNVGLVLTDPPYGLGHKLDGGSWGNVSEWDKPIELNLLLNSNAEIIMWGGNNYPLPPCRGWLSWFKPDAPPSMGQFELAWRNVDARARQLSCSISETNAERVGHPTQKPVKVMQWCIGQSFTSRSDLILDPFMGSGTTLVAAKQLGRKCVGIEINERFCELAAHRCAQPVQPSIFQSVDVPLSLECEELFR